MVRRTKKSPSMISRAKEALREEFERNPGNPSKSTVRKLGLAFLFNTPGARRKINRYPMDSKLSKVRRVVTRTATVRDGKHWATIKMDKISVHKRRPWVPRQLGRLAFRGEPSSRPIEILSLATAKIQHRAEVSEPSALPVAEVAALMLSIPTPASDKQK